MVQTVNQTIYNIVKNGDYFYNPRYAAINSLNTDLGALLNTVLGYLEATGATTPIQTYLTTGAGGALVPSLITAPLGILIVASPGTYTFTPDATFDNSTQAVIDAFKQTDFLTGAGATFPTIAGLYTIAYGAPTIGGATYPNYAVPAANTFLSTLEIITYVMSQFESTTFTNYSPTASVAANSTTLAWSVIGSILGSIDALITTLDTAINVLTAKFNTAAYSPISDSGFLPAVTNLLAAATALTTRLQLEVTTFNNYVKKVQGYTNAVQIVLHYQDPIAQGIVELIGANPSMNPNLAQALFQYISTYPK